MTLLMSSLDMLVQHGSQPKPLVAVFALINLFGLAQVIVVEVDPQAGKRIEIPRIALTCVVFRCLTCILSEKVSRQCTLAPCTHKPHSTSRR